MPDNPILMSKDTTQITEPIARLFQGKNFARDPRLAISVLNGNNPYEMVTVRGRVTEQMTGSVAEEHIDKMAKKYLGVDKYPGRSPGEKRVVLRIKPQKIFYLPPIR